MSLEQEEYLVMMNQINQRMYMRIGAIGGNKIFAEIGTQSIRSLGEDLLSLPVTARLNLTCAL